MVLRCSDWFRAGFCELLRSFEYIFNVLLKQWHVNPVNVFWMVARMLLRYCGWLLSIVMWMLTCLD